MRVRFFDASHDEVTLSQQTEILQQLAAFFASSVGATGAKGKTLSRASVEELARDASLTITRYGDRYHLHIERP